MDYHIIGANIKTERYKQHLTQEQLAEKAGISSNFLACIETGIKRGSFETYVNIANALHVTLDTLTQEIISACSDNPLKDELIYYFDNADPHIQRVMVNVSKVIFNENAKAISDIKRNVQQSKRKKLVPIKRNK